MQNINIEKNFFESTETFDIKDSKDWKIFSNTKNNNDIVNAFSFNNIKILSYLFNKQDFYFKNDKNQKLKTWKIKLKDKGFLWIISGDSDSGTILKASINSEWTHIKEELLIIGRKLVEHNNALITTKETFKSILDLHGQSLFDFNTKESFNHNMIFDGHKDLRISFNLNEMLDEIPEYWQSLSTPPLHNREIYISLSDLNEKCDLFPEEPKLIFSLNILIDKNGKMVGREEHLFSEHKLLDDIVERTKTENEIYNQFLDVLNKNKLEIVFQS